MRTIICVLATAVIASFTASVASATDLGDGYHVKRRHYVERPFQTRAYYVGPRYYEPYYYAPVVVYYRPYPYYDPYPYYAPYQRFYSRYYSYGWGRPIPYWRRWHHAHWGPRYRW
jgi:hypothetical protein